MDRFLSIIISLMIVAVIVALLLPAFPWFFFAITLLIVGWLPFLVRVGPEFAVQRGGVVAGVAALVGVVVATHQLLTWATTRNQGAASGRTWSPRGTARFLGGLLAVVVGGVAAAGGLTQLGRLMYPAEPWYRPWHGKSQRYQSVNNLRQIGLGLLSYSHRHDQFPPGAIFDSHGTPLHGWPTSILPFVDNIELSNAINLARPWDDPTPGNNGGPSNRAITSTWIGIYKQPGAVVAPRDPLLGYATNAWVLGGDQPRRLRTITDGLAQTILAGEAAGDFKPWGSPVHWRDPNRGINRVASGFGSARRHGANFLFADGSVRFLRNETPMLLFRALATPDGGEQVDQEQLDEGRYSPENGRRPTRFIPQPGGDHDSDPGDRRPRQEGGRPAQRRA